MVALDDTYSPAKPGDVLLGKYRIERVLGAGGMGVVVAAMHLELEQRVAIKFLSPEVLEHGEAVARFMREARASVRIRSEHVARVIDVGRLDNQAPYMVMEYLNGEDMASAIRRGAMPVEEGVDYVIQACDAMAEAHVEGIIHRDLKPANLFLAARTDGSSLVKVLDFGISKLVTPELRDPDLTKTSAILGSPLYMSPEQMRSSRTVDLRTDIWSLGVILFEALAGRTPFTGTTFPELIANILSEPTPDLLALRADLPPELCAAVTRCLEKDPAKRFQNVGELTAAIVPFGSRRSRITAERVLRVVGINEGIESSEKALPLVQRIGPSDAPPESSAATNASWTRTEPVAARRNLALIGGAAGLAVLLAIGLLAKFARGPAETAKPAASDAVAALVLPSAPIAAPASAAPVASGPSVTTAPEPNVQPLLAPPEAAPPIPSATPASGGAPVSAHSAPRATQTGAKSSRPTVPKKTLKIELK